MTDPGFPLKEICALLGRVSGEVPFYQTCPSKVEGQAQWHTLPFITAEDVAAEQHRFMAVRAGEVVRRVQGTTSGTTGPPRSIAFCEGDLERTLDFFTEGMRRIFGAGALVVQLLPAGPGSTLGLLLKKAFARMDATLIDASSCTSYEELTAMSEDFTGVLGMPRHVLAWGRYMVQHKRALRDKRLLVSADGMTTTLWQMITTLWESEVHVHYGLTEACYGAAVSTHPGGALVLRQEDLFAEVIDSWGRVLPLGATGELVLSTLRQEGMPLVRYRTGDWASLLPHPGGQALSPEILRMDGEARRRQMRWQELMGHEPLALDVLLSEHAPCFQFSQGRKGNTTHQGSQQIIYSDHILARSKVAKQVNSGDML